MWSLQSTGGLFSSPVSPLPLINTGSVRFSILLSADERNILLLQTLGCCLLWLSPADHAGFWGLAQRSHLVGRAACWFHCY